jgi:hypothetical protein
VQPLELHVSLLLIITSFLYCFPVPKKVLVWGAVVQDLDASFGFVVYTSTIPSSGMLFYFVLNNLHFFLLIVHVFTVSLLEF